MISGRVQGVGFRWFLGRHARRLGLVGYARNLPDGRVEVLAEGPAARVAELETLLAEGPPGAAVESVTEVDYQHEVNKYNSFHLR